MLEDAELSWNGAVSECRQDGANGRAGNARIIPLKLGRPGPCLFLIPGTGGRVEGFANLAASLQTHMPVFAIEARGLDGSSDPDTSVEEMAKHYLTRIKTVQAAGPYFLLGHSFGGLVALEMALSLTEAKETVASLIMLDCVISKKYWPLSFYLNNLLRVRLPRHVTNIMRNSVGDNLRYYFRRLLFRMNWISVDTTIGNNSAISMISSEIARAKYYPKFYPNKLTLFCTREWTEAGYERLWCNRVRELEIHLAAGDHMNLIYPPNVSSLAINISACLMNGLTSTTFASSSTFDLQ
jgi:thioesterase domain-containing protein